MNFNPSRGKRREQAPPPADGGRDGARQTANAAKDAADKDANTVQSSIITVLETVNEMQKDGTEEEGGLGRRQQGAQEEEDRHGRRFSPDGATVAEEGV